jgi:hypothetical protein
MLLHNFTALVQGTRYKTYAYKHCEHHHCLLVSLKPYLGAVWQTQFVPDNGMMDLRRLACTSNVEEGCTYFVTTALSKVKGGTLIYSDKEQGNENCA